MHLGQEASGRVIARLIRELPIDIPEDLVQKGMVLDTFYVPARYPNSHREGAPFEHYGPLQSEEGIDHAREIVAFVRSQMA
jgi:HEPN domain-containing protein